MHPGGDARVSSTAWLPFGEPRLFVPILVVDQSQVFSRRGGDSRRL